MRVARSLQNPGNEFVLLDAMRFVAATLVVFHHWKTSLMLPPAQAEWADRLGIFQYSVDLFFMLSGFIICHVYGSKLNHPREYRDYLVKRFARLYPLHILTLLVICALAFVTHDFQHRPEAYGWGAFIRNLFLVNAWLPHQGLSYNIVTWSISVEIFCYLICPLGLMVYRRSPWLLAPWIVPVGIAFLLKPRLLESASHWRLLLAIPEFFFGVALYGLPKRLPRVKYAGWICFGLLLLAMALAEVGVGRAALFFFPPLIFLVAVASHQSSPRRGVLLVLAALGQLTYSVYMWHIPLQFAFGPMRAWLVLPVLVNSAIAVLYVVLLVFSYYSFLWIETPARKWLTAALAAKRVTQHEKVHLEYAP